MEQQTPSSVTSWRTLLRWSLTVFAIWLIAWMILQTGGALLPFIFGLIAAYVLLPLVNKMTHWMPRWVAITVIYLVGIGLFVLTLLFIVPSIATQVGSFIGDLPNFWDKTAYPYVQDQLAWYRKEVPENIQTEVDSQLGNALQTLKENASSYASNGVETILGAITGIFRTIIFFAGFLIVPFWLFYVLLDEEKGKAAFDRLLPAQIRPDIKSVLAIVDRVFSAYIRGQVVLGVTVGMMSYVGLWIVQLVFGIEIPYKLLLAVVAGFTELIPVIGPIIGAVPALIVGLSQSVTAALIVGALYIIIQQIENNVLVPRIIGSVVEIHASILMILLVVSAQLGGLIGVILSAPLAAVARDTYRYISNRLREPHDPKHIPAGALPITLDSVPKDEDLP